MGTGCGKGQGGGGKKGGARGWGDGGGEGGKGVGRGFNQSFEQNRYRYIEFGYRNAHYETKLAKKCNSGVSPIFGREFPCNDIIVSQKRQSRPKSPKTRM